MNTERCLHETSSITHFQSVKTCLTVDPGVANISSDKCYNISFLYCYSYSTDQNNPIENSF